MTYKLFLISSVIFVAISFVLWVLIKDVNRKETNKVQKNTKINFSPKGVLSGSDSHYDIKLTMNPDGKFHLESTVIVKNDSTDSWDKLVFYFIPNMFTKENSPQLEYPATIQFNNISLEGKKVEYNLDKDTLNISLAKQLVPSEVVKVEFSYDFTLPEKGLRFSKDNGNFYLAQFYPMVATYQNHKWNKEEYLFHGETYHTGFSNFKVVYDIPNDYTLASTSENDKYPSENKGSFEINNTKEVFIAILKNPNVTEKWVGNINVRVLEIKKIKNYTRK